MTTDEAVAAGMKIFAVIEGKAAECSSASSGFKDVFEAIRDAGVISDFECRALRLEAKAIVYTFEAAIWAFHAKTTQRAQLKGIDVPQPRDGGGHR